MTSARPADGAVRRVQPAQLDLGVLCPISNAQSPNSGNSHFLIIITSKKLTGMSRLAGQREIYKVLEKEMKNQIHALQIKIIY